MNKIICVLDYGSGNQKSLVNIIKSLGYKVILTDSKKEIQKSSHVILPGVGSYDDLMQRLKEKRLIDILNKEILINRKPFLGICVGMQILSTYGYEFKKSVGLNWINGIVKKIDTNLKLPHVGWNNIKLLNNNSIVNSLEQSPDFYFLHSYIFFPQDNSNIISTTEYGTNFPSIINYKNIFGFQFHPEKSQINGKIILKNFFEYNF
jgi:glutamine amidotransferase